MRRCGPTGRRVRSAALAAVGRWRYPADPEQAAQTVKERLEFSLANAGAAAPAGARKRPQGGVGLEISASARRSLNYGEVVEIGLINACREPLLVFGCAQGTGGIPGAGSAPIPRRRKASWFRRAINALAAGPR